MNEYPAFLVAVLTALGATTDTGKKPECLKIDPAGFNQLCDDVTKVLLYAKEKNDVALAEAFASVIYNGKRVQAILGVAVIVEDELGNLLNEIKRDDMTIDQPSMN